MVTPKSRSPEFYSAPASPPPSGAPFNYEFHYASAPNSPARASAALYHPSENSPMISRETELLDFAFVSGSWSNISTADELFEKGRIRALQPPAAVCPRGGERGRQRSSPVSGAGNRGRESRSLSPLRRDNSYFVENTTSAASPAAGGSRKWRLKDLLLFRSASEGRATGRASRDPLFKYTLLSSLISSSRKKGDGKSTCRSFNSGHEVHYAAYRAAAEEQRKKTALPYEHHGLFGCLQFNPAIRNIAKGLSGQSSSRGR